MRIHLYALLWNEAPLLPYFFRHYDPFIERYVLYDNGSDDGTLELLARHRRVEVRHFASEGDSVCETGRRLKSSVWKESRGAADLVLVCDVDELLHHEDLPRFLRDSRAAGTTLFRPEGWEMIAATFPTTAGPITDEVTRGFRSPELDKPCLFDPDAIDGIHYAVGCHTASPTGRVVEKRGELRLLHFKLLGAEYVARRYAALRERLGPRDRREGWGRQYAMAEPEIRRMLDGHALTEVIHSARIH